MKSWFRRWMKQHFFICSFYSLPCILSAFCLVLLQQHSRGSVLISSQSVHYTFPTLITLTMWLYRKYNISIVAIVRAFRSFRYKISRKSSTYLDTESWVFSTYFDTESCGKHELKYVGRVFPFSNKFSVGFCSCKRPNLWNLVICLPICTKCFLDIQGITQEMLHTFLIFNFHADSNQPTPWQGLFARQFNMKWNVARILLKSQKERSLTYVPYPSQ